MDAEKVMLEMHRELESKGLIVLMQGNVLCSKHTYLLSEEKLTTGFVNSGFRPRHDFPHRCFLLKNLGDNVMMHASTEEKWSTYAEQRNLSRNRLLLNHHAEVVADFLSVFANHSTRCKVLDIGPANGFFLVLLRELGFNNLQALEISPVFIQSLKQKNLHVVQGDILTRRGLKEISSPVDVVLLMEVLEHLERPEDALENVHDLLTPGGIVYATVPIKDCIFDKMRRFLHGYSREQQVKNIDETHIHAFDERTIRKVFESSGFEVTRLRRISFVPPSRFFGGTNSRSFLLLRAILPQFMKGLCLSVIARKR